MTFNGSPGRDVPLAPASTWAGYQTLHLLAVMLALGFFASETRAEDENEPRKPITAVSRSCLDCGVVRAIREIRTEREVQRPDVYITSPQYRDTRPAEPPRIGPAISLTWGAGERPRTQFGVIDGPGMRQRYIDITYELNIRFDDGRFGLIEQDDINDLRVGDRVIVIKRRVEKIAE